MSSHWPSTARQTKQRCLKPFVVPCVNWHDDRTRHHLCLLNSPFWLQLLMLRSTTGYVSVTTMSVFLSVLLTLRTWARTRAALQLEVLALRHPLQLLHRTRPPRVRVATADRWLWVTLSRTWTGWRTALVIVKPETVIAWHRRGFRFWWAWKSRRRLGRPTVPPDVGALIRTMAQANPQWGAPRIHGELLKLGIDVSHATVAKYMGHRRQPPAQTWRSFLRNHIGQIVAADFFVVPTVTYRLLFGLVLLDRRRVVHVAVTADPTSAWTAQQRREAFPWDETPRDLLHDRDHAFDCPRITAKAMGIAEVLTAPRAPWQNPYAERFIGSVRRECLDHVIVFGPAGRQRLLKLDRAHYERSRTHLSLNKDAPIPRPVAKPCDGRVVAIPQIGGRHHRYERRAA
jgi:putative transposase